MVISAMVRVFIFSCYLSIGPNDSGKCGIMGWNFVIYCTKGRSIGFDDELIIFLGLKVKVIKHTNTHNSRIHGQIITKCM